MKNANKILYVIGILILSINTISAKRRVPDGNVERINLVADLPDKVYRLNDKVKKDLDLATLYEEFVIAWVLPVWTTKDAKLVLVEKDNLDEYYELSDEQLNEILKENNLNKEELLKLDWYTKYGGKLILIIVLIIIIYGIVDKEKQRQRY